MTRCGIPLESSSISLLGLMTSTYIRAAPMPIIISSMMTKPATSPPPPSSVLLSSTFFSGVTVTIRSLGSHFGQLTLVLTTVLGSVEVVVLVLAAVVVVFAGVADPTVIVVLVDG